MDVLNKLMFFSSHVIVLQSSDLLERWSWGSRLSSSSVSSSFSSDQSQSSSAAGSPAPPARTHTHSLYFMTTPQIERKQLVCEWMKGREEEEWDLLQCGDLGHLVLALSHFLPQNVKQLPHLRPTLLLQRVMIETLRTNKNRKSTECSHHAGWLGISMNEPQQFTLLNVSIYS